MYSHVYTGTASPPCPPPPAPSHRGSVPPPSPPPLGGRHGSLPRHYPAHTTYQPAGPRAPFQAGLGAKGEGYSCVPRSAHPGGGPGRGGGGRLEAAPGRALLDVEHHERPLPPAAATALLSPASSPTSAPSSSLAGEPTVGPLALLRELSPRLRPRPRVPWPPGFAARSPVQQRSAKLVLRERPVRGFAAARPASRLSAQARGARRGGGGGGGVGGAAGRHPASPAGPRQAGRASCTPTLESRLAGPRWRRRARLQVDVRVA